MTGAPLLRREGTTRTGRALLVRPTSEDDVPALLAIVDAVSAEGRLIAAEPGDRTVLEMTLGLAGMLSQGSLSLTAEVDGEVVARLTAMRHRGRYVAHVAELGIVVAASARGQGVGRALMETAVDWARAVGVRKLSLGVFPDNAGAIGLYRSLGFVEEGVQRGQVRIGDEDCDLVLMALLLGDGTR